MCKKKSFEEMTLLDWLVVGVVSFQLLLIIFTMISVITVTSNTRRALMAEAEVASAAAQAPVAAAPQVTDSLQIVTPAVAPASTPKEAVVTSNAVADSSPTIISIILTLITLCVTLSIVIPYVEGKSMTEGKVRTLVKENFMDAFYSVERSYSAILEDSLWEDAHASRMTGYLLGKSKKQEDRVWSIGFSSKAILRYVKLINQKPDRYGHNAYHEIDFIKQCLKDIERSISSFDGKVDAKKMLRAFSDLSFAAYLSGGLEYQKTLKEKMRKMYSHFNDKGLVSAKDVDAVVNKHGRSNDEKVMKDFKEWLKDWVKDEDDRIAKEKVEKEQEEQKQKQ